MGGACGQGKAVQDSETGSLGGLQACEGQPGSGWSGWTVDCGVRGQPFGQPLQALEPAVVRELLPSAGAAGRHSKGEWWDTTVGRSNGCRPNRSGSRPTLSGADCGAGVSPRLLRLPTRQVCDRCVRTARERCWRHDWVLDLDIKAFFDSIDWELMLRAVRQHTDCPWALLYIERWLKAPVQMEDGSVVPRTAGTPQGGVISPLLANLFLHYAFDAWMARTFARIPFERYADDIICHCKSAEEARALWSAVADRFAACKLVLHPEKTKIVYCKDVNRRGDFPDIHFDFLGFQFRARKIMWVKADRRIFAHSFQPAASPKALTRISREIRSWALHHRSDKSLTELAQMYNPCIRGCITYYSHFYKTQLRPTLKRIDAYGIRWARRKFKRMRHQTKGARDWFDRLCRANPTLFAHWQLCHGNGRISGAV